jgi:hypothetical protein
MSSRSGPRPETRHFLPLACRLEITQNKGMSSVSSTDGGYQYYKGTITDLEDQIKEDASRAERRNRERTDDLEKSYQAELADKDRQTEETIRNVKTRANEAALLDREMNKNEIDRVRNLTYDKFGRYNGADADSMRQQLEQFKESSDAQHAKDQHALSDDTDAYNQKLELLNRQHEQQLEEAVQTTRDSANETYDKQIGDQKANFDEQAKINEKKYNQLNAERMDEVSRLRRRSDQVISEAQMDFDHRTKKTQLTNDNRFEAEQRKSAEDSENAINRINNSHANESRVLHGQIQDLLEDQRRYQKDRAQGTHDAIEATEVDNRMRQHLIEEGYQSEISKLKQQAAKSDSYATYLQNQALGEKDRYFAELINKQNVDNHKEKQDITQSFIKDRDQMDLRAKRDRELASDTQAKLMHEASEERYKALENQAMAYENSIANQRESADAQIRGLEDGIRERATSQDASLISPAAEHAVRKSVASEYDKTLNAEQERHQRDADSILRSYSHRLQETILDRDARDTQLMQDNALEQNRQRSQFVENLRDTEFLKDQALRSKDWESNKQEENVNRNYSGLLERQRREYEGILNASRSDAQAKLSAYRQESEFDAKMNQRAFSARQNEIIRDYEKKLADQKLGYELQIDEIKTHADEGVREGERKSRIALDEQGRSYEQRIAQLEQQHKERERYISDQYNDQLEKLRRSNALLVSKKS